MSKINKSFFSKLSILVILLSFLFIFEKNLQAQDPIPVVNPGPATNTEPETPPATEPDNPPPAPVVNPGPNTDSEPAVPPAEPNNPPPNQQPVPVTNPGPTTTQPTTNNTTPVINSGKPQISVPPVVDPDNPQPITISNLDTNTMYSIVVEKLIFIDRRLFVQVFGGNKQYTKVFLQCLKPDKAGQIVVLSSTSTFLRIPGFYTLKFSKGHMEGNTCKPDGDPEEKKFTVGNPSKPNPDEARACCNYPKFVYSPSTDTCDALHFFTTAAEKTECAKNESTAIYCEPQSQTCFDKKTAVSQDRICKEPAPGTDFDLTTVPPTGLDKYAVCGASGGQRIEGCNDPTKPGYDSKHPAVATAIGCIPTNPPELVQAFMTFIIGISGGLAFLLMLLGAFQMLTSAGNPETLHAGRERLTSAIIGLLIVIFATLLLQIIGLDILKIPGFKP